MTVLNPPEKKLAKSTSDPLVRQTLNIEFFVVNIGKGQLISKANCQAEDSSKKQTNEFIFTSV